MFKETFLNFSDTYLVALGFILFMVTFLGALTWTLFVREKDFYSKLSRLPLHEGELHGK